MIESTSLVPAILLLAIGISAIVLMRKLGLSPIVGYMIGGLLVGPHGFGLIHESQTVHLLAELGVVFLLFDIGLHFSLRHIWEGRRDILGLGPLQIAFSAIPLAGIAWAFGLSAEIALIVGGALAISSTAVVQPTLHDRQQENCPVGRTATAMLIMQDVLAVFLLILAASLGVDGTETEAPSMLATAGMAFVKGAAALGVTILLGRTLVRPLFHAISRTKNEEIFTAIALLIVLAMAAASGWVGLSLTLGAFLGGMMLSETPFRHLIRTEVKPFRHLLLAFFFISIGMSLDWHVALESWWQILVFVAAVTAIKGVTIALSAKVVGWSVPGSIQLGSLMAQGSEFVFVIFSMPALRSVLGEESVSIVFVGVAISMALTPSLAEWGNRLARFVRTHSMKAVPVSETTPVETIAPVVVFGMGPIGRTVADALEAHHIAFDAIDGDFERFSSAMVDGYQVKFGDLSDLRLAETMSMNKRHSIALTAVSVDVARDLDPIVRERFPRLGRFIAIDDEAQLTELEGIGMTPVIDSGEIRGLALAERVLRSQGVDEQKIAGWMQRRREAAARTEVAVAV